MGGEGAEMEGQVRDSAKSGPRRSSTCWGSGWMSTLTRRPGLRLGKGGQVTPPGPNAAAISPDVQRPEEMDCGVEVKLGRRGGIEGIGDEEDARFGFRRGWDEVIGRGGDRILGEVIRLGLGWRGGEEAKGLGLGPGERGGMLVRKGEEEGSNLG